MQRVAPPSAVDWYNVDLPNVIALRDQVVPADDHAHSVAVATTDLAPSLFPFCDRSILLADRNSDGEGSESSTTGRRRGRSHKVPLLAPEVWDRVLESVVTKS